MDEITMFAELRPSPPADADLNEMRTGARRRVVAATEPGTRARRRRMPLLAGGLTAVIAAATGAAVVLASGGTPAPAGHAGTVVTAAWTVKLNANGTITVEFRQFADPARLQQVLRADGVNAYVRQAPWVTLPVSTGGPAYIAIPRSGVPVTFTYPACSYANTNHAPQTVQQAVVTLTRDSSHWGRPTGWRINPAGMPAGSALFWVGGPIKAGAHFSALIVTEPVVLNNDTLPACVPNPVPSPPTLPSAAPSPAPSGSPSS
jgi:hypothetical protein